MINSAQTDIQCAVGGQRSNQHNEWTFCQKIRLASHDLIAFIKDAKMWLVARPCQIMLKTCKNWALGHCYSNGQQIHELGRAFFFFHPLYSILLCSLLPIMLNQVIYN